MMGKGSKNENAGRNPNDPKEQSNNINLLQKEQLGSELSKVVDDELLTDFSDQFHQALNDRLSEYEDVSHEPYRGSQSSEDNGKKQQISFHHEEVGALPQNLGDIDDPIPFADINGLSHSDEVEDGQNSCEDMEAIQAEGVLDSTNAKDNVIATRVIHSRQW